jgi:hypothetical protein
VAGQPDNHAAMTPDGQVGDDHRHDDDDRSEAEVRLEGGNERNKQNDIEMREN